jgi:hypothetical protein
MAEDDGELPWDSQTDAFVNDIDTDTTKNYNVSLRKLLLHPEEFENVENMADTIDKIKADVTSYFEDTLAGLKDEEVELTKQLESVDSLYSQINQTVSSRAGIARVPFLKPVDMDLGNSNPETIYIDKYDGQADMLITKLVNESNYVCDLSDSYRKYRIGNWVFSGSKTHVISVQPPESIIVQVENSRDTITSMLDDISGRFFGA